MAGSGEVAGRSRCALVTIVPRRCPLLAESGHQRGRGLGRFIGGRAEHYNSQLSFTSSCSASRSPVASARISMSTMASGWMSPWTCWTTGNVLSPSAPTVLILADASSDPAARHRAIDIETRQLATNLCFFAIGREGTYHNIVNGDCPVEWNLCKTIHQTNIGR